MVHLRIAPATGMLLTTAGNTVLVKTQTEFNRAPAGHPAWHPGGKYLAFSVYKVRQFFHAEGVNRDVLDFVSHLILYKVESNIITTCQSISDTNRFETYPAWSPDGNWLYFCSTPRFDTLNVLKDHNYKNVKYDLMRVEFDQQTATFGKLDTFLSSAQTGMSITFPRFSPDGRYLLFCMSPYGNFPLARSGGHLYTVDMQTEQVRKLECNSERSDSYHSWSSNGRWFVFSSRRDDGISARPYFTYFDEQGKTSKAFVLPQEDPTFYESELQTFNIPELINGPIRERPQELLKVARQTERMVKAKFVPSGE
jgi:Tol biopolymer transport system component